MIQVRLDKRSWGKNPKNPRNKEHKFVENLVDYCLMSVHENFELLVKKSRKCFVRLPWRVEISL